MEVQTQTEAPITDSENLLSRVLASIPEKLLRQKTLILLLSILVLAALLRFYRLGQIPAGVEEDETSAAYDAYALLTHGTDR